MQACTLFGMPPLPCSTHAMSRHVTQVARSHATSWTQPRSRAPTFSVANPSRKHGFESVEKFSERVEEDCVFFAVYLLEFRRRRLVAYIALRWLILAARLAAVAASQEAFTAGAEVTAAAAASPGSDHCTPKLSPGRADDGDDVRTVDTSFTAAATVRPESTSEWQTTLADGRGSKGGEDGDAVPHTSRTLESGQKTRGRR